MAKRRMFSQDVVTSDKFLDMPGDAQRLYFFLILYADDDGFVASPKSVMRMCNVAEDNFKILIAKKYVIPFESGVIVIRHWKLNNYIQKDRYTETLYQNEKAQLAVVNGAYMLIDIEVNRDSVSELPDMACIQSVSNPYTEDRIGEERTGEERKDSSSHQSSSSSSNQNRKLSDCEIPTLEQVTAFCEERHNNIDPEWFMEFNAERDWMIDGKPIKWKMLIRYWERNPHAASDARRKKEKKKQQAAEEAAARAKQQRAANTAASPSSDSDDDDWKNWDGEL